MKITTASSGKKRVKISKSEWESIGKKAGWMNRSIREKLNWKDRSELESILESVGIASYPNETDDDLKDAIISNIEDGTLDPSVAE